ncbi:hypothetical protein L7F22_029780 [Adiantum nelumboides]|nr:hypothetical protein [Adiantum nelumboides]
MEPWTPDWSKAAHSMGTTIMAVQYDKGVIMGADSRTSTGAYVANRASDKITCLTDNVYLCRSGSDMHQVLPSSITHFGYVAGGSVFQSMAGYALENRQYMPSTMFEGMQNMVSNPMYANIGMQPRFWGTQGEFGVSQGNLGMACFSIPPVNMTPRHHHVTGQGVQIAPAGVLILQIVSFDNLESTDKSKPYKEGDESVQLDTFNGFDERTKAFPFLEQFDE